MNVPENLDPPPFNSFPVAARSSSRSGCTRLGSRSPFNSFPVAAVGFDPVYPVVYKLFQFFPSCCSSGLRLLSACSSLSTFNSFPVAAEGPPEHSPRGEQSDFQFFPSCCPLVLGCCGGAKNARKRFQFFPSCCSKCSKDHSSLGSSFLSILSQLLLDENVRPRARQYLLPLFLSILSQLLPSP